MQGNLLDLCLSYSLFKSEGQGDADRNIITVYYIIILV